MKNYLKKVAIAALPLLLTGTLVTSLVNVPQNTAIAYGYLQQKAESTYKNILSTANKEPKESRLVDKTVISPFQTMCQYHEIEQRINDHVIDLITIPALKVTLESTLSEATRYDDYFEKAAEITGLDKNLIKAYITVESGHTHFSPNAESHKKAIGPAQMLEETARRAKLKIIKDKTGKIVYDERRDIEKAIIESAKFIKPSIEQYDMILGVAGYNAGENAVKNRIERKKTDVFAKLFRGWETERYVINVFSIMSILENPESYSLNITKKPLYSEMRNNSIRHTMRKGETINTLLKKYKTDKSLIEKINPAITDLNNIPAGIKVYIPKTNHKKHKIR